MRTFLDLTPGDEFWGVEVNSGESCVLEFIGIRETGYGGFMVEAENDYTRAKMSRHLEMAVNTPEKCFYFPENNILLTTSYEFYENILRNWTW